MKNEFIILAKCVRIYLTAPHLENGNISIFCGNIRSMWLFIILTNYNIKTKSILTKNLKFQNQKF